MGYYTSRLMAGLGGFDPYASNLIARLTAKGETPTASRQIAMNTAIVALRAEGLFETQFDVLVVTRGYGEYTTKENWIKDAHHALAVNHGGTLTYTAGVGYNSDGTKSYLRTQYNPYTQGNNYSLNSASFFILCSGTLKATISVHGSVKTSPSVYGTRLATSSYVDTINSYGGSNKKNLVGYNCITRLNNTVNYHINDNSYSRTESAVGIPNLEQYILAENEENVVKFYAASTEINEAYGYGKNITQSQFLTFQSIMNNYFASI